MANVQASPRPRSDLSKRAVDAIGIGRRRSGALDDGLDCTIADNEKLARTVRVKRQRLAFVPQQDNRFRGDIARQRMMRVEIGYCATPLVHLAFAHESQNTGACRIYD